MWLLKFSLLVTTVPCALVAVDDSSHSRDVSSALFYLDQRSSLIGISMFRPLTEAEKAWLETAESELRALFSSERLTRSAETASKIFESVLRARDWTETGLLTVKSKVKRYLDSEGKVLTP